MRVIARAARVLPRLWPRQHGGPRPTVVEDPDELGYRLVCDPLLDVMDAGEWYALEHAALDRVPVTA
jgi:hypothetical protein